MAILVPLLLTVKVTSAGMPAITCVPAVLGSLSAMLLATVMSGATTVKFAFGTTTMARKS